MQKVFSFKSEGTTYGIEYEISELITAGWHIDNVAIACSKCDGAETFHAIVIATNCDKSNF